ncbi:hypothetical protein QBC42DRAFT_341759 [Cladorrhinum samala]|uniref:Uncharacterized protein n=1 Tax=Cladorrhinum samala TaxID=585594 RepID=A0AAV9HAF2_9PEZI|nr:hypothetical protein QBC42DRAFT_341759 [Cladorrhinum samala]
MLSTRLLLSNSIPRTFSSLTKRHLSTLPSNPSIKVFPHLSPSGERQSLLTYLDTHPPNPSLAIGTTTALPPTPQSFSPNPKFLSILNDVLAKNAAQDPELKSQAQAFASPGGFNFIQPARGKETSGASGSGGAGGAGVGGWVHLSDRRNPPDFGRIAWPEDILGSVEVDGKGEIIGNYQPSGTYRIITNEGILGLSPFLEKKLIARLREEETKA